MSIFRTSKKGAQVAYLCGVSPGAGRPARIVYMGTVEKVFNLLMGFNKMSIEELHNLYIEMIPILKYNYNLMVEYGSIEQLTKNLENSILEEIK